MNIQELIKAVILNGEKLSDFELTKQDLEEIQLLMKSVQDNLEKAKFIDPKKQKENRMKAIKQGNMDVMEESGLDEEMQQKLEKPKKPSSHLTVVKEEVLKIDDKGQWSIEKAIKPAPSLDYSTMNRPKQQPENKTQTIDYSSGTPKITGKQWNTKDVTPGTSPVETSTTKRMASKERRIKEGVKSGKLIDDRVESTSQSTSETAAETFARRNRERNKL